MRQTLSDSVLADLGGISRSSLRRYAERGVQRPSIFAERLHWLARVAADLAGSYNEF